MADAATKTGAGIVLAKLDAYVASLATPRHGATTAPSKHITLAPRRADMPLGSIVASQVRDLDVVFRRLIEEAAALPDVSQKDMLLRLAVRVAQQSARSTQALADIGAPRPTIVDVADTQS